MTSTLEIDIVSSIMTTAKQIISVAGLPGIARVEDASDNGTPAMKIVFVDGVEATVMPGFVNKARFDIWLPPVHRIAAASIMPNVDEEQVMMELNKLAAKAAAIQHARHPQ